jgi:hypothetical protein
MKYILPCILFSLICLNNFAQAPIITSVVPSNGPIGTLTVLNGSNFSSTPANNIVYFGPVKATVSSSTNSSISVSVPFGTNYKPVTVLSNNLIGSSKSPFLITNATGGHNFVNSSFANSTNFGGGSSIIEGDFDLDGKIDIASTVFNADLVIISKNTSNGGVASFTNTNLFGAVNPIAVKTADINNDGLLDLIVAGNTFNVIYVFKNTSTLGNISFTSPISFGVGSSPRKLTTGDIDNDGKIDIISSNQGDNSISILRNTTAGAVITFSSKVDFATSNSPEGVTVGDLDDDGKIDILVACSSSSAVSLLKNVSTIGNINLNPKIDYTTGSFPWEVVVADINNDGKLDIITSNTSPNTVSIFKNTSTTSLSFANHIQFETTSSPRGLAVHDLDTDGKPDIVTVNNFSSSQACVLKNTSTTSNITFNTFTSYPIGGGCVGVAVADFNSDGLADIMSANSVNNNGSLSFLKNQLPINTGIPTCPQLLLPLNNSSNIAYGVPLLLKWKKEVNATSYQVKITPTTGMAIIATTTDTSYSFTPLANNTYNWSASPINLSAGNVCVNFTFTTCNVINNTTTINVPSGILSKCVSDSILIQASSSTNLQWFLNNQLIIGATANSFYAKESGSYTIRISNGGCYSDPSNSITITNLNTPNKPTLSTNGPTTFCSNSFITLSSPITNETNQWYKNNALISGANASSYVANTTGSYFIKLTNGTTSCSSYSDTISITVNPVPIIPTIQVSGNTLTATSGYASYKWFFNNAVIAGSNTNQHIALSSGNYKVEVTDNNTSNCKSESAIVNHVFTSVNNIIIDGNKINVYPNPFKENLNINVAGNGFSNTLFNLKVINTFGKKIAAMTIKQGNNNLNFKSYSAGTYILIIQKGNQSKTLKVIKL